MDSGVVLTATGGDDTSWVGRGNSHEGVYITSHSNTVQHNVIISANATTGITLSGSGAYSNNVYGNYVGTDGAGVAALGNGADGVYLINAAANNIGGNSAALANLICGNAYAGISLNGAVQQRRRQPRGSQRPEPAAGQPSRRIYDNASFNTITNNTSVANAFCGIALVDPSGLGYNGTLVAANDVGVVVSGNTTTSMGNGREGIYITTRSNTLHDNVISGNVISGISLSGSNAHNNNIYANRIGTDASSTTAMPNPVGVLLNTGTHDNIIGSAGAGNFISGNDGDGVFIDFNGGNFAEQ